MPLEHFSSDGVDIAFLDSGEGDPILLIHGFASNHVVNWGATGWIDTLKRDGRRVVAMDVRGHGKSAKAPRPRGLPARRSSRTMRRASSIISASRGPT